MKKTIKVFCTLLIIFVLSVFLFSCEFKQRGSSTNKWDYSKSEAAHFIDGSLMVSASSNGNQLELSFTMEDERFKGAINPTDVLVFVTPKMDEVSGYLKYDDIKSLLVPVERIELDGNHQTIIVTINGDIDSEYGILINKNAISSACYAIGFASSLGGKIITEYEEEIIKQKGSWDSAKQAIEVASYISQIVLSFISDQTVPFAGGLFGLASTLGSAFFSGGPSLDSIAKQIDVIDGKIDALSAQIDANQKEILDEFVRTQAMIDEVKVISYNQNITAYQTDYVKPLTDYILIYKDSVEQALKAYVKNSNTVSLYYGKNAYSDNELLFASEDDLTGATMYEITIDSFPNATAFLSKNHDIVGDGLPLSMYKDIELALTGVSLPNGRSKEVVIEDIYKTICDHINLSVLSKDDATLHRDVLQFINNFVSYANAIAGINFESVINSYISRLEYIYNFSSEIKPAVRDLLASIKLGLDYYVCLAQSACMAQGINYLREIADAYDNACTYILNIYNAQMAMPDNYCYPLKQVVSGQLYNAICNTSFTNLGNHPDFHASFLLRNNLGFDGSKVVGTEVDVNQIAFVNYQEVRAIVTRYNLLKAAGQTKEDKFIYYLKSVGIVKGADLDMMNRIFNAGYTIERYGQILTSYAIKGLNNSDNLRMYCQCYGNPDSSYFLIGRLYNYRQNSGDIEAQYWSGRIATGDIVNCETGTLESDKKISAYARYSESHFFWIDDEHWGFIDDVFGLYCFIISKQ